MKYRSWQNYSTCLPLPEMKTSSIFLTKQMLFPKVKHSTCREIPMTHTGWVFQNLKSFRECDLRHPERTQASETTTSCSSEITLFQALIWTTKKKKPRCVSMQLLPFHTDISCKALYSYCTLECITTNGMCNTIASFPLFSATENQLGNKYSS